MSDCVLDSSALMASLNGEPGKAEVDMRIDAGAAISAVNLSEVVAKFGAEGQSEEAIRDRLDVLTLEVVPFDAVQGYRAGLLRPLTSHAGLSFADRACLAVAEQLGLPAVTADHAWARVSLGVEIQVIR